jgi:ATPase involved in DNA repair/ATPase family associated with various cellular activities (AAA)
VTDTGSGQGQVSDSGNPDRDNPADQPVDVTSTEPTADAAPATSVPESAISTTTFDLLKQRLKGVADRLTTSTTKLNSERAEIFASVPLALGEQDRLRTDQPSIPRDAVSVGNLLLVGYNAGASLGRNREISDTFALHQVDQSSGADWNFTPLPTDHADWFLGDAGFTRDIGELFTYYADTRLDSLTIRAGRLLMVFRVGSAADDLRILRWQMAGDVPQYIDAYGDHDLVTEAPYDFGWTDAGRDLIAEGRWRHYRINGLYVGLDKGGLEFRIDDVVEGGRTIHRESVVEAGQSIDEMHIAYAELGEVLVVRLLPYRESDERFFVFNKLTRAVQRADAIGRNCHQLPEGQGVVFPGGYHLQNGENKVFATDSTGFVFHASHRSPNGEDILYVYFRRESGEYLLCAYNVVARSMDNPIVLNGYALFPDGVVVGTRAAAEPQRVHTIAVYTSPFCVPDRYVPNVASDSFFGRTGNPELVRAIGEVLSLGRDAREPQFNRAVFEALVSRSTSLLDQHGWLNSPEAHGIGALLVEVRRSAGDVLDEFSSVVAQKKEAADRLATAQRIVADLAADAELELRDATAFIDKLAAARAALGLLSELADVRQIDHAELDRLRAQCTGVYDHLATRAIGFLDTPESLDVVLSVFTDAERASAGAATAAAIGELAATVDEAGNRLVLLTEVVGGLDVADPTRKTSVLSRLAEGLARRNAVRAALDQRASSLRTGESAAGFAASMAVLSQRATAALTAAADAPACDAALASLTAELENIELAYGDIEGFAEAIDTRRNEVHGAFTQRRDSLAADRTRRIDRLVGSAERVLATVTARASTLPGRAEIDAFFATDSLVTKVRSTTAELRQMGEAGRSSELEVALATARDQARRTAADRSELFEAGTVKIGRWKFGVNTEPFELRLDTGALDALSAGLNGTGPGGFRLRLTGTDLTLPCRDERLGAFFDLATQTHPSETATMPRALYLAFETYRGGIGADGVSAFATGRIEEGYEPGVHDADAIKILTAAAGYWTSPALYIDGTTRAIGGLWLSSLERKERDDIDRQTAGLRAVGPGRARAAFVDTYRAAIEAIAAEASLSVDVDLVVNYVVGHSHEFAITATGEQRASAFREWATEHKIDLRGASFGELVRLLADRHPGDPLSVAAEAAWAWLDPSVKGVPGIDAVLRVEGLISSHPMITGGVLTVDLGAAFTAYLRYRLGGGLERFTTFTSVRREVLASERRRLEIDRLRSTVISSFVRNRLIDEVYLPLVGDNIARQLGLNSAAQGLLLLISPPGYGKTTLIEYVASLLGFALVKINGPALGSDVTSLDPGAATNAAAAEELAKLNRAFAMGNNVICYLDDIQHTSPELLQKFIPLCDATRRIEGVLEGEARTFSLSGKRFVMAMAGNPYTSDGTRFRIPDMLANRADVHNLGDVAQAASEAFAQSYVENACGVNDVLAPVLGRSRGDLEHLLRAAGGDQIRSDQLQHPYGASELDAVIKTLRHLTQVRDQLLKVNAAYIASATMDDNMRGEPQFLLQGSYRNMARIAQRIVPAMTSEEVAIAVAEHYRAESQTLAAAAAWNLSKLGQILGVATAAETADFEELRERWRDSNVSGDPMAVMANALRDIAAAMSPHTEILHGAVTKAAQPPVSTEDKLQPPKQQ